MPQTCETLGLPWFAVLVWCSSGPRLFLQVCKNPECDRQRETEGCQMPRNSTLMGPVSSCLLGLCFARCMFPVALIAFLVRSQTGEIFTIRPKSVLRGPKQTFCLFLTLFPILRAAELMMNFVQDRRLLLKRERGLPKGTVSV